jgi:hypothetical protein
MSIMRCECCDKLVDTDNEPMGEDGICEGCEDAAIAEAYAKHKPSYDAEKHYGIAHTTNPNDQASIDAFRQAMKDAGR